MIPLSLPLSYINNKSIFTTFFLSLWIERYRNIEKTSFLTFSYPYKERDRERDLKILRILGVING